MGLVRPFQRSTTLFRIERIAGSYRGRIPSSQGSRASKLSRASPDLDCQGLGNQLSDSPDVICDSGFHGRGNSQRFVNPAEVVIGEPKRISEFQILPLLAESIGQPSHKV